MDRLTASQEKLIRQLRSPHGRKRSRYLVIEGLRAVETMLRAGIAPEFVVVAPSELTQPGRDFAGTLANKNISLAECDSKRFKPLTDSVATQGIMAVAPESSLPTPPEAWADTRLILLLDSVSDPGNLGAIIRTAAGCNVDIVALSPGCADILNPKVIRSTAGTIFTQPILRATNLETFLGQLQSNSIALFGADAHATATLDELQLPERRLCIAFGSEADGLSARVRTDCSSLFRLRIANRVESFNVAASAAIAIHDVSQRLRLI